MIIKSLLDTDLYKLTMSQMVYHQFPKVPVKYRFVCRNKSINLSPYVEEVKKELAAVTTLNFSAEEISYLRSLGLFQEDFLDYLAKFQLNPATISVGIKNEQLSIEAEGLWVETILWEIYVLSIVNEVYFRNLYPNPNYEEGRARLKDKITKVNQVKDEGFKLIEFGTRRRFSAQWQEYVTKTLKDEILGDSLVGTSNVYLAMKLNIKPIGTLAHELLQSGQALSPKLKSFQSFILKAWYKEYQGKLGISLTDVISTDSFLKDFPLELAQKFDGLRHDSGDPILWADKIINFYENNEIDAKTKMLVFSDGLDIDKALNIFNHVKNKAKSSYGIGTNLTNDLGYPSMNIVMKMVACDNKPVAKISDEPSKAICDDDLFLAKLKKTFGVKV